jgi:hypothetical protein
MRIRRKTRKSGVKRLPGLPQPVPQESLALLEYIRSIGVKKRSFNILQSSESRLKTRETMYHF